MNQFIRIISAVIFTPLMFIAVLGMITYWGIKDLIREIRRSYND